jgi:hypothetical protein
MTRREQAGFETAAAAVVTAGLFLAMMIWLAG